MVISEQLGALFHKGRVRETQKLPHCHLEGMNNPRYLFKIIALDSVSRGQKYFAVVGYLRALGFPGTRRLTRSSRAAEGVPAWDAGSRVCKAWASPRVSLGTPKPSLTAFLPPSLPGRSQLLTSPFRKLKTCSCYYFSIGSPYPHWDSKQRFSINV